MRTASLPEDRERIPRVLLRAILALILVTVAIVATARITGQTPAAMPPELPIVQERVLRIFGDMDGSVTVLDQHGSVITQLSGDKGGFISGVARSLERQRVQAGVETAAPVRLVRFSDGRLALRDDHTAWRAELIGFGKDNTAAFARLLED